MRTGVGLPSWLRRASPLQKRGEVRRPDAPRAVLWGWERKGARRLTRASAWELRVALKMSAWGVSYFQRLVAPTKYCPYPRSAAAEVRNG